MGNLERVRTQVVEGRIVDPLPTDRRAALRWLNKGTLGVLAGTLEQIDYTRRLIDAQGVPVHFDAPVATGRAGELLVNFRIGEPARHGLPLWPFVVAGLIAAGGIVVALVILASAIAAYIGTVVVAAALVGVAAAAKGSGGITQNNYFR